MFPQLNLFDSDSIQNNNVRYFSDKLEKSKYCRVFRTRLEGGEAICSSHVYT